MSSEARTAPDTPAWSGSNVAVADVVAAVDGLRSSEQKTATRTSVATLVIVTRNTEQLDDADTVIELLGVRHPARIVTLLASADAGDHPDRIDADVVLHAGRAAGHAIWSDELRLRVSGGPSRHPASLIRPLVLSDLPVVVWYVHGLPNEDDPLLKLANAVIVDSKTVVDAGDGEPAMHKAFATVTRLARKHTIIDLSWSRLRSWRRLLASQFQGDFASMLNGVTSVEVTGKLGPRTLLGGWLSSRLALPRETLHLYDGRHVAMVVNSQVNGRSGEVRVERVPDAKVIRASASIDGGPGTNELVSLPNSALPESLSQALKLLDRDKVYEMSIKTIEAWQ